MMRKVRTYEVLTPLHNPREGKNTWLVASEHMTLAEAKKEAKIIGAPWQIAERTACIVAFRDAADDAP